MKTKTLVACSPRQASTCGGFHQILCTGCSLDHNLINLIISIVLNWTTVQTDYMNAFTQALLEEEIYMEIPRDFTAADVDNEYVLKMNESLYSLV